MGQDPRFLDHTFTGLFEFTHTYLDPILTPEQSTANFIHTKQRHGEIGIRESCNNSFHCFVAPNYLHSIIGQHCGDDGHAISMSNFMEVEIHVGSIL